MAIIIIPVGLIARVLPASILAFVYTGIGMLNGATLSLRLVYHQFYCWILLGIPLLALGIWFIAWVAQRKPGTGSTARAAKVSPGLLMAILILCLVSGLGSGRCSAWRFRRVVRSKGPI